MLSKSTGSQIVAELSGHRPWWKLGACDVQPWVRSLHPSAVQELVSRTEWIGEAWDGLSDIQVGRSTLMASETACLLRKLRRGITKAGLPVAILPDASSVRQCLAYSGTAQMVAIDIDLGGLILPVAVWDWQLRGTKRPSIPRIAATMLSVIAAAASMLDRLVRRELRLRRALEETAAKIGPGVAPLWLRMSPFPMDEHPGDLPYSSYVMSIISLNECLEWTPTGDERVSTVKDIRNHDQWIGRRHRARAQTLAQLASSGSEGSIDELSLALIGAQGSNPGEIFRQARREALADRRGNIQLHSADREEKAHRAELYYRDGRLEIVLGFEGGVYTSGTLSVWGDFPETIANVANGKRLDQFVDHPAFRETGVVVGTAEARQGALDLKHRLRSIPIEEAERRWKSAANGPFGTPFAS